jgi:hypothetical protein
LSLFLRSAFLTIEWWSFPVTKEKPAPAIILHTRVCVVCLCACARWPCICSLIGMQSLPLLSPPWSMRPPPSLHIHTHTHTHHHPPLITVRRVIGKSRVGTAQHWVDARCCLPCKRKNLALAIGEALPLGLYHSLSRKRSQSGLDLTAPPTPKCHHREQADTCESPSCKCGHYPLPQQPSHHPRRRR